MPGLGQPLKTIPMGAHLAAHPLPPSTRVQMGPMNNGNCRPIVNVMAQGPNPTTVGVSVHMQNGGMSGGFGASKTLVPGGPIGVNVYMGGTLPRRK